MMVGFSLEYDIDADLVMGSVDGYGRDFERRAAEEAAFIMRSNIRIVPLGSPSSPAGGYPYSRTGELPRSVRVHESPEGYFVGPEYRKPESKFSLQGGARTIAQLINDGGIVLVRRRIKNKRGNVRGQITVRQQFLPRPYLQLTLEAVAERAPQIASQAELN